MTHSGGKPHAVGDRGQRYEVTFFNPTSGKRETLGWTTTSAGAEKMKDAIKAHPSWKDPEIIDRQLSQI